jgi:hypothetical protein
VLLPQPLLLARARTLCSGLYLWVVLQQQLLLLLLLLLEPGVAAGRLMSRLWSWQQA